MEAEKREAIRDALDDLEGGGSSNELEAAEIGQAEAQSLIADPTTPAARRTRAQNAMIRLGVLDPKIGQTVQKIVASGNKQARESFRLEAEKGAKQAAFVTGQKDFAGKQRAIRSLATAAAARGEPLERFIQLQNMSEPDLDLELQRMKIAGTDIKTILGEKFEPVRQDGRVVAQVSTTTGKRIADPTAGKPQTDIGKARSDLSNGLITQGEFNTIKNAPKKFQSKVGKLIGDRQAARSLFPEGSPQIKAFDAAIKAESKGEGAKLSDVGGVRKEFTKLSGDFIKIRDAIGKVRSAADNPSAAGDLALIFNFMKILDPGSVVRESEFANAANAAGVPERVRALWNRALEGERLSVKTRTDFVDTANRLFTSQTEKQKSLETAFRTIAERSGMNPADVVVDFKGAERGSEAPSGGPQKAPTATNPETGEKLILRDGKWQAP